MVKMIKALFLARRKEERINMQKLAESMQKARETLNTPKNQ